MKYNKTGWQRVSNNVSKRMIDLSLIHKLIPYRKIRRRTKVMNTAIKHFHCLRTYSQYVKMKISVFRNLSEDSDTDDEANSTDDDYMDLQKLEMSIKSEDNFSKTELDISKYDTSDMVTEILNAHQLKNTVSNIVNFDSQEIIKNETEDLSGFIKENISMIGPNKLNETNNDEYSLSNNNSTVCEEDVISKNENTFMIEKCTTFNRPCCVTKIRESEKDNTKSIEEGINTNNNINGKLVKRNCNKTKISNIKKNLISSLNQHIKVQDINKPFTNSKINLQHHYSAQSIEDLNVQEVSINEKTNSKFIQIQSSFSDNKNQPKDSGIDEDTEEEFPEDRKGICVKRKKNIQKDYENVKIMNFQPKTVFTIENMDDEEKQQDNMQKQKLQLKVTCNEIISKKYRIVSSDTLINHNNTGSKVINNCVNNKEMMEFVETDNNTEDSMSALFKRRLQQLRRLNLTMDSESSPSEDDNQYCNTENMRDKLFSRSKESSESLESEDDTMIFKNTILINNSKKLRKNQRCRFENDKKRKDIYLGETCTTNTEDDETFNSNVSTQSLTTTEMDKTYPLMDEHQKNLQNLSQENTYRSNNENNNSKENIKFKKSFEEMHKIPKNLKIGITLQSAVKNSTMRSRPCNLQELIEKESLIPEIALPSVTLKDLQENDIYLLDVPSMVLESKLLGREFILTKKELKLGKQKYKITVNDVGHVSCVFNTGKSYANYETVNVKPMKRIIAHKTIHKQ